VTHDTSVTRILRVKARGWYWLRENFSLPAVLTILGAVGTLGSWCIHLNTKVAVQEGEIHFIRIIMPDKSALAAVQATLSAHSTALSEHETRITQLEADYDTARTVAGTAPVPHAPAKRTRPQ
jgi:hypothetical protein